MSLHSIFKRGCLAIAIGGLLGFSGPLLAASAPAEKPAADKAEEKKPIQILFTNVNIFDGFSPELKKGMSVLVENNYHQGSWQGASRSRKARSWLMARGAP